MVTSADRTRVTPGAGERLRRLRKAQDLSQADIAKRVGITPAAVSNYELGKRELPLSTAVAVAAVFNIDVCELVTD